MNEQIFSVKSLQSLEDNWRWIRKNLDDFNLNQLGKKHVMQKKNVKQIWKQ